MIKKILIHTVIVLFLGGNVNAQLKYTLEDLVSQARLSSPEALKAGLELKKSQYQYNSFRGDYMPNISASGTLPNFRRSIQNVTQNDGTIDFIPLNQINTIADLNVVQKIGATGGQVFMNSGVERFQDFNNDILSFRAVPISIGVTQPIFRANPYKWNKQIESLQVKVARKSYVETMEEVAMQTSNLYFDMLLAQVSIEIASKNVSLNDTLYKIAKGRYNLGKIAENELLQMKLSYMNSQRDLKQAKLSFQSSRLRLIQYLDMDDSVNFELVLSENIPTVLIDKQLAMQKAMENRSRILEFEIRKLEAEKNLKVAIGSNRFNADLRASYGFNNTAENFGSLYQNPSNQSGFSLGVSVPLYNGGKNRNEIKIAKTDYEIQQINLKRDIENFKLETKLFIEQFPLLKDQLKLAFESDTIAMNRYDIAVKRYMIGKTDITDLNIALNERNQAKRGLLSALKAYWEGYYKLRFYTLYDFENQQEISYSN